MIKKSFWNILLTFVAMLSLAFSLAGCGDEPDPNEGIYRATVVESDGITFKASLAFDEFNIELKSGEKGSLTLNGEEKSIKWKRDDNNIEITVDGDKITGTVENGVMYLPDFDGEEGMNITLECEALKGSTTGDTNDPDASDAIGSTENAENTENADDKKASEDQGIYGRYDAVSASDSEDEVWLEEGEYLNVNEDGSLSMYVAEQSLEFNTTIKNNKFYLDGETVGVINDDGTIQLELNSEVSYVFAREGMELWDAWQEALSSYSAGGEELSPDEIIGHYDAVYIFDENQEQQEASGEWLEVNPDGTAALFLNGKSEEYTFTIYGETEFYLTDADNNDILGFYGDGWIHLSIDNLTISFAREDAAGMEDNKN